MSFSLSRFLLPEISSELDSKFREGVQKKRWLFSMFPYAMFYSERNAAPPPLEQMFLVFLMNSENKTTVQKPTLLAFNLIIIVIIPRHLDKREKTGKNSALSAKPFSSVMRPGPLVRQQRIPLSLAPWQGFWPVPESKCLSH